MKIGSTLSFSMTKACPEHGIDQSNSAGVVQSLYSGTGVPIYTAGPCSSSMDEAWKLVGETMFPEWASIVVERQWAGRGQQRRVWHSPSGNIYASVRLPCTEPPWHTMLSLLTGVMVLEFLKDLGLDVELKWPNDLLIYRKKVGGILIEEKKDVVIAGIGLNLGSAPGIQELGASHSMPAACLREFGVDCSPLAFWSRLVEKGIPWFQKVVSQPTPVNFIAAIERDLAFAGEKVFVVHGDGAEISAVIEGIDRNGGLRIKTAQGIQVIQTGSIYPATL